MENTKQQNTSEAIRQEVMHTATPWYLWAKDGTSIMVPDEIGHLVLAQCVNTQRSDTDQNRSFENAAFIIRACNSHEQLVEVCRTVLAGLNGMTTDQFGKGADKPLREALEAALAAAAI